MPKTSRKPRTLLGCTMPETTRPRPKMKPHRRLAKAGIGSTRKEVVGEGDDDDGGQHEHDGGDERARRQPRDAANAVARRAAAAEPRAEADQKSGDGKRHA